jgi:hypothetical protein
MEGNVCAYIASTVADTIPDAFLFMYLFEAACTIQLRNRAGESGDAGAGGGLAGPALLRRLDGIDPGYGM